MMGYLVVFVGAGVGGAIRHGMNIWVARQMGTHFPWHTFLINISGSLVMGLVAGWFIHRSDPTGHIRLFLTTGILGGYTTFSAFSLDAVLLWERHEHLTGGALCRRLGGGRDRGPGVRPLDREDDVCVSVERYDVIVAGGGAAGLMCAMRAGQRGRRVLVLEHADKVGKKILISGGGRCNFTNLGSRPEAFLSANPHFCKSALARYTQHDFIALVEKHRITWHEKTLGQLFCDGSARQIVAMLLAECGAVGVEVKVAHRITGIDKADRFAVATDHGAFPRSRWCSRRAACRSPRWARRRSRTTLLAASGLGSPRRGRPWCR
jgi:protein CrcB